MSEFIQLRTCSHRESEQIFEHNSVDIKEEKRRNTFVFQVFMTKISAEFAEKMFALSYENK
ncbi:MAG: hypothetical protein K5979_03935, partial [Ruminococcus sp.]|nr:hypothetical protein [Ruminococcus sp.]